ncbi:uncharacterized protein Triagg1_4829 [Trichoderma aggressivum f. europaeum]|uniref:Actin-related protein 2/3 complex subunit 3 n=1 Tax=Trichoderma aggressivum f. europaeum TaxID=173218 RepID=A0AAE1M145_9HYPO|nr:hypothetical protein Triagg1_4829 [Trichoderma aggressivum f. europaeum]
MITSAGAALSWSRSSPANHLVLLLRDASSPSPACRAIAVQDAGTSTVPADPRRSSPELRLPAACRSCHRSLSPVTDDLWPIPSSLPPLSRQLRLEISFANLDFAREPQAYNSDFNSDPNPPRLIGNFPLLPLRTKTRGPAYVLPFPSPPLPAHESPEIESESYDILDEVLRLFRANTFFRNFEIKGPADRLLVYGIWFVSDCLQKIKPNAIARDAAKEVNNLALDLNFAIPGDPGFPLNQVCPIHIPTFLETFDATGQDAEQLKLYMAQVRQELASRLLARVYEEDETKPSKWWLSFTKRKFMNKSL